LFDVRTRVDEPVLTHPRSIFSVFVNPGHDAGKEPPPPPPPLPPGTEIVTELAATDPLAVMPYV